MDLGLQDRGAVLSEDGLYRYLLWRLWDRELPRAMFVMLNPSTADAEIDDPTIRRCIGFARSWGMGGIYVTNLYPYRATNPADLWQASKPMGQGNDSYIERHLDRRGIAVAAWGAHGKPQRVREVRTLFFDAGIPLYALKLTKDGAPGHPLYLPAASVPVVYEPARNQLQRGQPWTPTAFAPLPEPSFMETTSTGLG